MLRPRIVALIGFLLACVAARAQTVTVEATGHGTEVKRAFRLAEERKIVGWPNLADGDAGTLLVATFDLHNADLILLTADSTGPRLLKAAQTATVRARFPKADFLTFSGTIYESVDIELNDSLVRASDSASISIPLGRIVRELKAAGVPQPIVVSLRVEPLAVTKLDGAKLDVGSKLLLPAQITEATTLEKALTRPPWAYAAATILILIGVGFLIFIYLMPMRILRSLAHPVVPEPAEPTLLPQEEVQAKYDAAKPWKAIWPILPMPLVLLFTTLGKPWMELGFAGIATVLPSPPLWLPFALVGPMFLFFPFLIFFARRRKRESDSTALHPEDGDPTDGTRALRWMPLMVLPVFGMLVLRPLFPGAFRSLGPSGVLLLAFVPLALGMIAIALGALRDSRRQYLPLAADDPITLEAQELADRAGVRIRKVRLRRSSAPNASVDLANNVSVTTRLRRDFPPEEIRAILAHEIGHVRHRHVWRGFLFSLLILGLWIGLRLGADDWMRARLSSGAYALWISPIWGLFAFPFVASFVQGRGSRRRELEADRFAAEAVGDREIVIRALERIHHLAQTPTTLRKGHEAISTHPSLARRIAALRSNGPAPL